jgi:hypothetical protein
MKNGLSDSGKGDGRDLTGSKTEQLLWLTVVSLIGLEWQNNVQEMKLKSWMGRWIFGK